MEREGWAVPPRRDARWATRFKVFAALSGMLMVSGGALAGLSAVGTSAHETVTIAGGAGSYSYYTFSRLIGPWSLQLTLAALDGPVDACVLPEGEYRAFVSGSDPSGTCVHAEPSGTLAVVGTSGGRFYVVLMHSRGQEGLAQRVRIDLEAPGIEASLFFIAAGTVNAGALLLLLSELFRRSKRRPATGVPKETR